MQITITHIISSNSYHSALQANAKTRHNTNQCDKSLKNHQLHKEQHCNYWDRNQSTQTCALEHPQFNINSKRASEMCL